MSVDMNERLRSRGQTVKEKRSRLRSRRAEEKPLASQPVKPTPAPLPQVSEIAALQAEADLAQVTAELAAAEGR
jgi:hypothetical protein